MWRGEGNSTDGVGRRYGDDGDMTGHGTIPVETLNTLQFENNFSDGGPSVYRVTQNENL